MKVNKLNESAFSENQKRLVENVKAVRQKVRQLLEDLLPDEFDSLAVSTMNQIDGYDPDWFSDSNCSPVIQGVEDMLFANAPDDCNSSCATDIYDQIQELITSCQYDKAKQLLAEMESKLDEFRSMIPVEGNFVEPEEVEAPCDDSSECDDCEIDVKTTPVVDQEVDQEDKLFLDESLLTEGPVRDIKQKIMNKIDPKKAVQRTLDNRSKDEKEQKQKKAPPVLAKDFEQKSQRNRFYPNVPNPKAMTYDQWLDRYADVATNPNNLHYGEWYNAIVTDENGYMIRRGAEDMHKKFDKYVPGRNDEIMKPFSTDDYKYYGKGGQKKKSSGKSKPNGKPQNSPQDGSKGTTSPEDSKSDPKRSSDKGEPKIPTLDRFKSLCQLTSLKVYKKDDLKTPLNFDSIKKITDDTVNQYKVQRASYRDGLVDLSDWLKMAKQSKFIESIVRKKLDEGVSYRYFITGDDVISGMSDNMSQKEIDFQLRQLNKIKRSLGLTRVEDIICYVDSEWTYDPTLVDSSSSSLSTETKGFTVDGVSLIAQILNGNIWLYFKSESDGEHYLDYMDDNF